MRMWIEVEGSWASQQDAKDDLTRRILYGNQKAYELVIEEAEQHKRDEKQSYIEFRVYLMDNAPDNMVNEVADSLQNVLIDETECLDDVCTQDVTYEVVRKDNTQ